MLLDTQTALWLLDDHPKLGVGARHAIRSASEVSVSAASVWELAIKSMLGKITMPYGLTDILAQEGLNLLAVTGRHAEALCCFPELTRHDPFDRMITAQAFCENLTLLTADRILLGLDRDFITDSTR